MSRDIFKGCLLVSDIDGTLLDKDVGLPLRNVDAINYFMQRGGMFSVATGRVAQSVQKYMPPIRVNAPAILCNGAQIYDFEKDEFLLQKFMNSYAFDIAAKIVEKFGQIGMELYSDRKLYFVNCNNWIKEHIRKEKFTYDYGDVTDGPRQLNKIICTDAYEKLQEVEQFVKEMNIPDIEIVYSSPIYLEIIPKGISKGLALNELANILNVEVCNTFAVGDYMNDAEMIDAAGKSFAVGNGHDEIKKRANYVVCSNNEGCIGDVVEILIKERMSK